MRLARQDEALACFDQVLARRPTDADALTNRGAALQRLGKHAEAALAYERVLREHPAYKYARGRVVSAKMYACDWSGLSELIEQLRADVRDDKFAANPFTLLACSPDESEQLRGARLFTADKYPPVAKPSLRPRASAHEKIRIAYVSGEFRAHATSYLIAGLLEAHDRSRFEIFGISTGSNDNSDMRRRLESAFDTFVDGSTDTDRALAEMLDRWEIDIAINLNGYFGIERTGIFALRPCPVQVNYLGFPGTMGADYIDYIIADEIVIPNGRRDLYDEQVVYLPDSYQVNDSKRAISDLTPSRADAGLPSDAFVFCCFNSNHKILPPMFDVWCRILRETGNSVLWLIEGEPAAAANLRREAAARRIAPDRLVFAPRAKLADHLARHRLADLFLDTLPHNAHTTASDALWAGLPVLTCRGSTFAGRVAASLLRAVGMEDLVTETLDTYEALAVALARDPALLGRMKRQLSENRLRLPLFDTSRYARHLESAYAKMWEIYCRGEKPDSFSIPPAA
jgi:predicted O-linked N-acetylglucosamine transferase (SPINDLY family)